MRVYMSVPIDFDHYGGDAYMAALDDGPIAAEQVVLEACFRARPLFALVEQNQIEWEMSDLFDCVVFPTLSDEHHVALKLAASDEIFFTQSEIPLRIKAVAKAAQ